MKTLVCVIGEARAWRMSWPSFKANVIDALNADLALCVGVDRNDEALNPFWQSAKYRWTSQEFEDYGAGFDLAQSQFVAHDPAPNWRALLSVKNQWLGGIKGEGQHPGSAGILIYYRWLLLKNLKTSGALDEYDRFVITRSDFVWLSKHPDMTVLDPNSLWVPDGEYYSGITDRHVVCSKADVEIYLDLIGAIIGYPQMLIERMRDKDNWNLEAYILDHLSRYNMLSRVKTFSYIMFSIREEAEATRWSPGIWHDPMKCFIKYPSEYSAAHFWSSLLSKVTDIRLVLRNLNEPKLYTLVVRDGVFRANKIIKLKYLGDMKAEIFDQSVNAYFPVDLIGMQNGKIIFKRRNSEFGSYLFRSYLFKILKFNLKANISILGKSQNMKVLFNRLFANLLSFEIQSISD